MSSSNCAGRKLSLILQNNNGGMSYQQMINKLLPNFRNYPGTAVGRVEVCVHRGAGLGATSLNGHSIQGRSNNALCRKGRTIPRRVLTHQVNDDNHENNYLLWT